MGLKNSKPSLLPPEEINPKPYILLPPEEINPKPSILLPDDIIEEILSRLPAKSLLRFRCVSKSWRSLIGSKLFIKNHHQNITKNETYAHWRVIYNCTEHGLKHCSLQSYYYEPSVDPSPFGDPKNNHLITGSYVVGHCNGVLCILKEPGCFFLWNPTTRISIELPKLELNVTRKNGFGWDEGSDAYKVFAVVSEKEQNIGKVYSTKTNSWKTVDHGCLSLCGQTGKFSCGKINWLKEGGLHIETFDLNTEVFGMMDHPCKPKVGESMWLYEEIDGCLSIACQSNTNNNNNNDETYKFWVMEHYGVKESWVEATSQLVQKSTYCCYATSFYVESLVSPV